MAGIAMLLCACPPVVQCKSAACLGLDAGTDAGAKTACGSDVELCAENAKNCGELTVNDSCGNPRVITCGTCGAGEVCGSAGVANVCAPHCQGVCPNGYSCGANGVCEQGNANQLVLDVKTVKVNGTVTVNGSPLIAGANCSASTGAGAVIFTDTQAGTLLSTPIDCAANTFNLDLPLGTYRVSLKGAGASNLPNGESVVLPRWVLLGDVLNLKLNTDPVAVSGRVTLNGQSPLNESTCPAEEMTALGHVAFIDSHSQVALTGALSCSDGALTFQASLPAGTYQVTVTGDENTKLPIGTVEALSAFEVTAPRDDLIIDLKTVDVNGALKLNGQTPIAGDECLGLPEATATTLFFNNEQTKTSVHTRILCGSETFAFNLALPPGTYQVAVASEEGRSNLPHGNATLAQPLIITAPQDNVVLALSTVGISGRVTLNGQEPAIGVSCVNDSTFMPSGYWVLHKGPVETGTAYIHRFSCDSDFSFSLAAPPGTYQVSIVGAGSHLSNLPEGIATFASPLVVNGATSQLAYDLKTFAVRGKVTLNGQAPVRGAGCGQPASGNGAGIFIFQDTQTGSKLNAHVLCDDANFSFDTQLPAGIYRVSLESRGTDVSNLLPGQVGFPFSLAVP